MSAMADSNPDPPKSLATAEELFRRFLASNGYPSKIAWVVAEDVVPDSARRYWIREHGRDRGLVEANQRYSTGLQRNLGIALNAFSANSTETFATIFIPADETDAQYHLMGRGLKMSCPTTATPASIVRNPIRWLVLGLLNRKRVRTLRQSGVV
jgi:hypothetical protein